MGQSTRIVRLSAKLFAVPLEEVLVDASHGDHTHFELVTATGALAEDVERVQAVRECIGIGVEFDWDALAPRRVHCL